MPTASFSVSGTPKRYTAKAASGRDVTTVFCGDCGSSLWREGGVTDPDAVVVRVGSLDDEGALDGARPLAEIYTHDRAGWLGEMEGAKQFEGMF